MVTTRPGPSSSSCGSTCRQPSEFLKPRAHSSFDTPFSSSALNLSQAETITYSSDSIDDIAKHLSGANPDWWMNGQDGFGMYRSAFMPRT